MSLIDQSRRDAKRKRSGGSEPLPAWAFDDKGAPLVVATGQAPAKPARATIAVSRSGDKTEKLKAKTKETESAPPEVRCLRVSQLVPNPFQPRRHFAEHELEELAASLREHGQLQPILVRPKANGFQIIAGERRWRAASRLPSFELLCVVRPMNDMEALVASHHENHARVNVRSFDNALFFARYGLLLLGWKATQIDKALKSGELPDEFPFDSVAQAVGMASRSVRRYTDLLRLSKANRDWFDQAPPILQPGEMNQPRFVPTEKHGRALLLLRDHPKAQKLLRGEIVSKGLSGDGALEREKELRPKTNTETQGTTAESQSKVEPTGSKSKKKATPAEMLQGAVFLIEQVNQQINSGQLTKEQIEALIPQRQALKTAMDSIEASTN